MITFKCDVNKQMCAFMPGYCNTVRWVLNVGSAGLSLEWFFRLPRQCLDRTWWNVVSFVCVSNGAKASVFWKKNVFV